MATTYDRSRFDLFIERAVADFDLAPNVPELLEKEGIEEIELFLRGNYSIMDLHNAGLSYRDARLLKARATNVVLQAKHFDSPYTDAWFDAVARSASKDGIFVDQKGDKWRPLPNSFYRTGFDLHEEGPGLILLLEALRYNDTRFMFKTVCDDVMLTHHPLVEAKVVPNGNALVAQLIAPKECYAMSRNYLSTKKKTASRVCEFIDDIVHIVEDDDGYVLYANDFGTNNVGTLDAPVAFFRAEKYEEIRTALFKYAGDDWLDTRQYGMPTLENLALRQAQKRPDFKSPNRSTKQPKDLTITSLSLL